jgi:hypothetical protein
MCRKSLSIYVGYFSLYMRCMCILIQGTILYNIYRTHSIHTDPGHNIIKYLENLFYIYLSRARSRACSTSNRFLTAASFFSQVSSFTNSSFSSFFRRAFSRLSFFSSPPPSPFPPTSFFRCFTPLPSPPSPPPPRPPPPSPPLPPKFSASRTRESVSVCFFVRVLSCEKRGLRRGGRAGCEFAREFVGGLSEFARGRVAAMRSEFVGGCAKFARGRSEFARGRSEFVCGFAEFVSGRAELARAAAIWSSLCCSWATCRMPFMPYIQCVANVLLMCC